MLLLGISILTSLVVFTDFMEHTIYEESTAHLTEIYHQANQTLYNKVSFNWGVMRMWAPYLESAQSDADVCSFLSQAKGEYHFTDFFFVSRDGSYVTLDGERGYLDLGRTLSQLILEQQPIVANSVVPDKPEIMVFAVPTEKGSYQGFAYEAIAVTYNNKDLVDSLKISAFEGHGSTFAVLPDGRVVLDSSSEDMRGVHNILAMLDQTFCTLDYHLRYTLMVIWKLIKCRIDNLNIFTLDRLADICHFLWTLIDQKHDQMHVPVSCADTLCNRFQQGCLTCLWRRYDHTSLSLSDRRKQIHDTDSDRSSCLVK